MSVVLWAGPAPALGRSPRPRDLFLLLKPSGLPGMCCEGRRSSHWLSNCPLCGWPVGPMVARHPSCSV